MYAVQYTVPMKSHWQEGFDSEEQAREWVQNNTTAFVWRIFKHNGSKWQEI